MQYGIWKNVSDIPSCNVYEQNEKVLSDKRCERGTRTKLLNLLPHLSQNLPLCIRSYRDVLGQAL